MKVKTMKVRTMQQPGSYRKPRPFHLPGQMNTPRRGRPGKAMPPMKRLGKGLRRGR